jgi:MFS family permease
MLLGLERKWWVLIAVGAGTFMSALDGSVVNTILPIVNRSFNSNIATVEWVVVVYLLVLSGLLLSFGRLGDLRGHKQVYLAGFFVFVTSSVLCAWSPSIQALISFAACRPWSGHDRG